MPYSNIPENLWPKMDRCVQDVQAKQPELSKPQAIAICHDSVMGKSAQAADLADRILTLTLKGSQGPEPDPQPDPAGLVRHDSGRLVTKRNWDTAARERLANGEIRGAFAGPDRSFPIAGPEDVGDAYQSLGRAPEAQRDKIRKAIIRIAQEYGWTAGLPDTVKQEMGIKSGRLDFPMLMTKADVMSDGRIRWRGRANTGEFDRENERFDRTFWGDVIDNFMRVQERMTKGQTPDLPIPILDISHASLYVKDRNAARVGWVQKCWLDGNAFMATGWFDDSPLGQLAAKAALTRPVAKRRLSVCVMPDYGMVKRSDGGTVYMGGNGRAFLDSIAMTADPIDPGTEIHGEKTMTEKKQKSIFDDALDVLGDSDEAKDEIAKLESQKVKSAADDGLKIKAEDTDAETETDQVDEAADDETPEGDPGPADQAGTPEAADDETPEDDQDGDGGEKVLSHAVTQDQLTAVLKSMVKAVGDAVAERLGPIEEKLGELDQLKSQVAALSVTETEKVKAALDDDGGDWLANLVRNSVQRESVKGGSGKGPRQATDDVYSSLFGNE